MAENAPVRPAAAPRVAYFSMEVGLDAAIPTYSGGLGVLAGDTLRGGADLGVPMAGMTLLHRQGYFHQRLDARGGQAESPVEWRPEDHLKLMPPRLSLNLDGRPVQLCAWRYLVRGERGEVPVYFLDADLPENAPEDRALTGTLYGGDSRYRLRQEALLGLGGVQMLRSLGLHELRLFHMNEGHSALLALALLEEQAAERGLTGLKPEDKEAVRRRCVFTTHTPVPAGHDQFPMDMVRAVLGAERADALVASGCCQSDTLNMTYLALSASHFVNGVAMRHGQISQGMFPNYPIESITNGVHASTWASGPVQEVFDRHLSGWRAQNHALRYAVGIPLEEVRHAHLEAKRQLLAEVERRTGRILSLDAFTLGFARRAAEYKRADLLFTDLERLKRMAREKGALQVLFAGKAHPQDGGGKAVIRHVFEAAAALGPEVPVIYLEEYDMALGRLLCSGVDLWLNTPKKPQEASGTSGMKAAMNGVPSLSVLDGWWIEGHFEGVTGWSVGEDWETPPDRALEAASLYDKLEGRILPLYYHDPLGYARVMRGAIALNGSFFNAQRMVTQYVESSYRMLLGAE